MRFSWKWALPLLIFVCIGLVWWLQRPPEPQVDQNDIVIGETMYQLSFDDAESFETAIYDSGALQVQDGTYLIRLQTDNAGYLWGSTLWGDASLAYPLLKNVVVEVDARLSESDTRDNWFGILCRVDRKQHGYAFLVSSDGFWQIARAETLADELNLQPLTEWQQSPHIDIEAEHLQLQAYCIDDYLALYVDGVFVGDHRDNRYNYAGGVGLLGGSDQGIFEIRFDDLTVKTAAFKNRPNTPTPEISPTEVVPLDTTPLAPPTLEVVPLGATELDESPTLETVPLVPNPLPSLEVVPLGPVETEVTPILGG